MNTQSVTYNGLTFTTINTLGESEINYLKHTYDFNQLDLDDFVNRQQVPKIEVVKDYILVVLDFPFLDPSQSQAKQKQTENGQAKEAPKTPSLPEVVASPVTIPVKIATKTFSSNGKKRQVRIGHVNFFIGQDYLVVLHDDKTPQINEIIEDCQKTLHKREELMAQGSQYLFYKIVDLLVDSMFAPMSELTSMIDKIDRDMMEDKAASSVVEEISTARRNLVLMISIVKPAIVIFKDMSEGKYPEISQAMRPWWRNVLDHLRKIRSRIDSSRELIEGISRSYESLLTSRTNEIVKVLTMFTAILLPLTLVASIYGMNIAHLPYSQAPNSLTIISLVMVLLALIMVLAFKLRRWL